MNITSSVSLFSRDPCWFFFNKKNLEDNDYSGNFLINKKVSIPDDSDPIINNLINELNLFSDSTVHFVNLDAKNNADIIFELTDELSGINTKTVSAMSISAQAVNSTINEGFSIESTINRSTTASSTDRNVLLIKSVKPIGLLYGFYYLLKHTNLAQTSSLAQTNGLSQTNSDLLFDQPIIHAPQCQIRMLNHWDNMNPFDHMGSVERGYAGNSIFFQDHDITSDLHTITEYARLLSSIGINAITINNVNVHKLETQLITDKFLEKLVPINAILEKFGITLFLSINFASPITLNELTTADPLSEEVITWWNNRAKRIYQILPNLGGFLVKADSEGRPGPFAYGRNHAEGANMLANAIAPFGGKVIWRCFVYNSQQDWRDKTTDRAKAAYDNFIQLDGLFNRNVILQIKNGPIDFQPREPVSPLLGAMPNTNCIIELQVTQEYTGQQKHVCYLGPQWKAIFDFDTHIAPAYGNDSTITAFITGKLTETPFSGITAVSNIGDQFNWCGHKFAQANLYAFGRLAWDPTLSSEEIADEWIKLSISNNQTVVKTVASILNSSWLTYERYTSPLGLGGMMNPSHHYGPHPEGYEYDRWGGYNYANWEGIGLDRTATGTNFTAQYNSVNQAMFNNKESCPEELLLFFHRLKYTDKLKSGKTLLQHVYDTHFQGAEEVKAFYADWLSIKSLIDEELFEHVENRLAHQVTHAELWRDVINTYFYRRTGIADLHGRLIYP